MIVSSQFFVQLETTVQVEVVRVVVLRQRLGLFLRQVKIHLASLLRRLEALEVQEISPLAVRIPLLMRRYIITQHLAVVAVVLLLLQLLLQMAVLVV
jgi:DNA-binding helix-hairpin-helix protein with protein kinase domain